MLITQVKKNIDSFVFAVIGFTIIYFYTRHSGIGISPDSVVYSSGAENLRASGNFIDYKNAPIIDFPVFYPSFLAFMMLITGSKILSFAPLLNALLFAFIIFLSGLMMERFQFRSRLYKIAVLFCIAFSPALLEDYSMLWSETVFILLLLLFVLAIQNYLKSSSLKVLIIAGVITALACITRYVGITVLGAGGLLILLNRDLIWRKRFIHATIFGLIGSSLLIINLFRNYELSKTLTGNREQSLTPLIKNIHDAGDVFTTWFSFPATNYTIDCVVAFLIIAGLSFIFLKNILKNKRINSYENIAAFFALVYFLFLIITATLSRFEGINSRFVSPIFIFLLWSATSWLIPLIKKTSTTFVKWLIVILGLFLFSTFQYHQLEADSENWEGIKDAGIPGYSEDSWTQGETVQFVQKDSLPFKQGYTIYSNAYDAFWWFTKRPGKFLPQKEFQPGIKQFLTNPDCYVVWFNDGENPDLLDKNFLTQIKKMRLVKEFNDGCIYEFESPAVTDKQTKPN